MTDPVPYAREVIRLEAEAVAALHGQIGPRFVEAVERVLRCEGQVVCTGMGKSGIIAQKISATLASVGTPSFFLHPAEASHGDLGRVGPKDLVLALSNSGANEEILRVIPGVKRIGAGLLAMTRDAESPLARHADGLLLTGALPEACPVGLAPTTSTTAQLALGDALVMTVAKLRNFTVEEYALYHPGGALGRQLLTVGEVLDQDQTSAPPARLGTGTREALVAAGGLGRRPGALPVADEADQLVGLLTDGDVRRWLLRDPTFLDRPIDDVMTRDPLTARVDQLAAEAWHAMQEHAFDELPVVDEQGTYVGLLDVQDLLRAGFSA